ncbi:Maleate isomerase [Paraburkholderia aspalathi]|nr:Maleate isomerase [Paraburkholderia aspalathi]
MKHVTKAKLERMDADSDRCADELSDGRMAVICYACLVAIMSMGNGYHRRSTPRLQEKTVLNGGTSPVVTSAGALLSGVY